MKTVFWLLDINDQVAEDHSQIRLWGINDKGKRILILDDNFLPCFYLTLDGSLSEEVVVEEIEKRKLPSVTKVEVVNRHFFGRPIRAIKVTVRDQELSSECAEELKKLRGIKEALEDDLRYSYRYLVDYGMNPCGWHKIEVGEAEPIPDVRVEYVYRALSPPKAFESTETVALRILAFSLISYSPRGTSKPDRSPLIIISCATNIGQNRQFIAEGPDDSPILKAFVEYVRDFDPDIIASYGGNTFEWPFLLERTRHLGLRLYVDRTLSEPHTSTYGHVSITGRANIDFGDFADEISEVKVKTLENIAIYMGILEAKFEPIEVVDYPAYWDDKGKRRQLIEYSMRRAKIILGVAEEMLNFALELSGISGLPLDQVGSAAVGFRTESYIIRQAFRYGELIPKRVERPYFPYQGAVVLKPKPGLHEDVAVLDFKSMYPNIMISYNISPDTYIDPKETLPQKNINVTPDVGHRFLKSPPGLYNRILTQLIEVREKIRSELGDLKPGNVKYRLLDARQRAVKVMTNAAYGYAGWVGARWYMRPVAEATAAWGRYIIGKTIAIAEEIGLDVIYGDTDSIFIKYDEERTDKLLKDVKAKLGLEIQPDEIYQCVLFTEAKKRYAGLLQDGRLVIVGLEVARGDWSEVAKKVQEGALDILLRERSAKKSLSYVHGYILDLRAGKVPYKDLVIWKTLTKSPSEYAIKAPHVEAAKRLIENGWDVTAGDKVGFVITKGEGKLYERAIPYVFASLEEVDLQYYEELQIVPSVLRILSMFGVTAEMVTPTRAVSTLERWGKG